MAFTLTMPEVGETVTEGTIEKWLKQPGEKVDKYEPIVEINTDKVNVELPSPVSGTVTEHLVQEGETVLIGAGLCVIEEVAGETPAEIAPPAPAKEPAAAAVSASSGGQAPQPDASPLPGGQARQPDASTSPGGQARQPDTGRGGAAPSDGNGARGPNRATPRVRKVAADLGVDLAQVQGSGPGGRIVEEDVRTFAQSGATPTATATITSTGGQARQPDAPTSAGGQARQPDTGRGGERAPSKPGADEENVPLTGVRRTIAQRMAQSAFSAPHAWLVVEADVTELVRLRAATKDAFRERHGIDLTYLPFVAHAVSQTLLDHPYLNASWAEDHIVLKKRVHLGVAVATERGLLVPVVRDADRLSVTGLARAMSELGEKTRANKLQLEDVQAGTFTLDNTGAFGSIISMPIINLGQSAIISLETITKRPVVVGDDAIAVRSFVNLCLSFDHRVLDGHQAGAFLRDVKKRLEAFTPDTGID